MNTLPTSEDIKKWTDDKLLSVVTSGERIKWNCGLSESQHEIDDYVQSVYDELEERNRRFNKNHKSFQ